MMTDDQTLAHQRAKRGNPYMPLSVATKMQREEHRWRHLEKTTPAEPCRYGDGTCLTHSAGRTR